jgi:hypothetical protein
VVACAWNPNTGETKAEDYKFETSMEYIVRLCLKRPRWGGGKRIYAGVAIP